jgi:hypothetical protein
MNTFLGVVIFIAIFLLVLRVITNKESSKTLPHNSGTGVGGDDDTGSNGDVPKI